MCPDHCVQVPSVCLVLMRLFPSPNFFDSLVKLSKAPSSSSCPLLDQSQPAPKRVSCFAQCKYVVCFILGLGLLQRRAVRACYIHFLAACLTTPRPGPSTRRADYKDKGDRRCKFQAKPELRAFRAQATCGHPCWGHHIQPVVHFPTHLGSIAVPVWNRP